MIVIIFGASGSAGGGVLQACLDSPAVGEVRAIARRLLAIAHFKLQVIRHQAFDDYSAIGIRSAASTPASIAWASRRPRYPAKPSSGT